MNNIKKISVSITSAALIIQLNPLIGFANDLGINNDKNTLDSTSKYESEVMDVSNDKDINQGTNFNSMKEATVQSNTNTLNQIEKTSSKERTGIKQNSKSDNENSSKHNVGVIRYIGLALVAILGILSSRKNV
ncbi:hypothetical protein [Paraclostridium sordellii]|uniref:hypothetical protein n=1 Tax=Paraclostridium sordellii TaxID=1505 RepID=UPI0005E98C71|nr:hypothetical protein [Paeniclostridium sordellii]CEO06539.1 Uncharacterised protein [[Clostridium] sordellii] [Paeniclostridium sordellii]CEP86571.1 Uncharacterised protein [[Clostridium] sordellii] [Paeniclostridium sordellii]CEP96822.1 Uncharacterised protein [[Clostridium] sordellii] [Paeniclostridium sordellii]CEP99712.1 Uncharacterised protein [[Clostridium] sordellii] [Paeniclostridium sordellii]